MVLFPACSLKLLYNPHIQRRTYKTNGTRSDTLVYLAAYVRADLQLHLHRCLISPDITSYVYIIVHTLQKDIDGCGYSYLCTVLDAPAPSGGPGTCLAV